MVVPAHSSQLQPAAYKWTSRLKNNSQRSRKLNSNSSFQMHWHYCMSLFCFMHSRIWPGLKVYFLCLFFTLCSCNHLCAVTQSIFYLFLMCQPIGWSSFITMVTTFVARDSWGPSECSDAAHHHPISISQAGDTEMRVGVDWLSASEWQILSLCAYTVCRVTVQIKLFSHSSDNITIITYLSRTTVHSF